MHAHGGWYSSPRENADGSQDSAPGTLLTIGTNGRLDSKPAATLCQAWLNPRGQSQMAMIAATAAYPTAAVRLTKFH